MMVFQFFSCIASRNLTKSFILYFISFLSQESGFESFKQSTCTLYASERAILLFKAFINACKLRGEMPIDWRFFLGVWLSVNSLLQIDIYHDHQYSESVSNKNLALCWQQNNCPGTTLFLFFSCWAIWKVITSPLTLWRCFINTAQHLLFLLSKTLPNTSS